MLDVSREILPDLKNARLVSDSVKTDISSIRTGPLVITKQMPLVTYSSSDIERTNMLLTSKRSLELYDTYPEHFRKLVDRMNPLLSLFMSIHDTNFRRFGVKGRTVRKDE